MKLLFVHGWNVTSFDSYGELPDALKISAPPELSIETEDLFLGRYINFDDEITLEDVARAFNKARLDVVGKEEFSCITHSTGGPVIRLWMHLYYGSNGFSNCPLKHLVMLAPANHGSALAALGKKRLVRFAKELFKGVEQGIQLLRWLQLGSNEQRELNMAWLDYSPENSDCYSFVLTGETIDNSFYDFINSYLVEPGSDGVIRICSANMNYQYVELIQNNDPELIGFDGKKIALLSPVRGIVQSPSTPLAIIPEASHSGTAFGIMRNVKRNEPVVSRILDCLKVASRQDYENITHDFNAQLQLNQETTDKFSMLIFRIRDDRGNIIEDFDMLLLAGESYRPDMLPQGFFQDRQYNKQSGALVYYINHSQMGEESHFGIRINARPDVGFCRYVPIEFRSNGYAVHDILKPNQTMLIDVVLKRIVDDETFRFEPLSVAKGDFSNTEPTQSEN
ncbi:esterase/lipase family protein [Halodesulfovibrio aestuarii]|uniref:Phospholipase n=1 Tax=Halodesulfovibrio aestuarii TaxID=126333 RepID=A0A8G2C7Y7_9BACT|nr:hypothetical protein [Halodesulfovibrio aestuarii]SHI72850.1 hypothetical protein SAMN05660830_00794 [Halodesulfovibrio aestuarii]